MHAVGIRHLKARLSEILRLVKTGETVLVTERDKVIAELRPVHREAPEPTSWTESLERLGDFVVPAQRSPKDWNVSGGLDRRALYPRAAEIVAEMREDRC